MTKSAKTPKHQGIAIWLGENIDYLKVWNYQEELKSKRSLKFIDDTLVFLTHSSVYTLGRRIDLSHIVSKLDAPLIETDRGGFVTYHGPGQLIGYPVIDLRSLGIGPKRYVLALENALICTLNSYGINAYKRGKDTGVWTEKGKIASIGVKISNGITTHGFALNISTDLRAFESIIACGLIDGHCTSMAEFSVVPELAAVAEAISNNLGQELSIIWNW